MRWFRPALLVSTALVLTWFVHRLMGPKIAGDFLCFWPAAKLLASGGDPYDSASQIAIQVPLGWDRDAMGYGLWDYLPYFYPPWLGMLAIPLLPLGYPAAKLAWAFLGFLSLLAAGHLCRDVSPGLRGWIPPLVATLFLPSMIAASQGQTSPMVLFALALAWYSLRNGWDRAAGATLAWLTVKPQVTFLLLGAILLWAARQGRWKVVRSFSATLTFLAVGSMLIVPYWPMKMLAAIRRTPVPTERFPELGGTWPLVLRTVGLSGWLQIALWASLALPAVLLVFRSAWGRDRTSGEVLSTGILAAFFAAPYGRLYDYALLTIPLIAMARNRPGRLILVALMLGPWVHLAMFDRVSESRLLPGQELKLYTFFWIPAAVTVAWLASTTGATGAFASRSTGGDGRDGANRDIDPRP